MTEMLAGVSAEISPVTVMVVLTGSGFFWSSVLCAWTGERQIAWTKQASIAPARLLEAMRSNGEDDVIGSFVNWRFGSFPWLAFH